MTSRILVAALAVFVVGIAAPQANAAPKKASAQQQKMKDCAVKWGDEKKAKNVSGRKVHNAFMSKCLKG